MADRSIDALLPVEFRADAAVSGMRNLINREADVGPANVSFDLSSRSQVHPHMNPFLKLSQVAQLGNDPGVESASVVPFAEHIQKDSDLARPHRHRKNLRLIDDEHFALNPCRAASEKDRNETLDRCNVNIASGGGFVAILEGTGEQGVSTVSVDACFS